MATFGGPVGHVHQQVVEAAAIVIGGLLAAPHRKTQVVTHLQVYLPTIYAGQTLFLAGGIKLIFAGIGKQVAFVVMATLSGG